MHGAADVGSDRLVAVGRRHDAGACVVQFLADTVLDAAFVLLLEMPALHLLADAAQLVGGEACG